jgi:uncharacterized membrane protein
MLAVLVALVLPIISIIALIFSVGSRGRIRLLEAGVAAQGGRLAVLEAAVARAELAPGRAAAEPPTQVEAPIPAEPPAEEVQPVAAPPEAALPEPQIGAEPDEPAPEPPPAAPAPPLPPPSPAWPGLEERIGTLWVVWVGGLAIALGGIFMVRYSIQQGWIGPVVRVALGALLGATLLAAGEWLRRSEYRSGVAGIPVANIPSILTAAGTTVLYATIYAAYALYGFVGPAAAFVLLGVVALATLGAALLHGPALAALGLVGAEIAPLLVATEKPDYWALYLYLAVVTAAAFALARARLWRWLAVTAVAFGLFWVFPGMTDQAAGTLAPHVAHVVIGYGVAALLIVAGLYYGPHAVAGRIDAVSSGAIAAYLLAAALLVLAQNHDTLAVGAFAVLVTATVAIAWRSEAAVGSLPAAGLLAALVIVAWAVEWEYFHLVAFGPGNGLAPQPSQPSIALHFWLGAFFAVLFGATGFFAQGRYQRAAAPLIWSTAAVLTPLAILVALYYRIYNLERSVPFAGLALLLAAWLAVAAELLTKRPKRPGIAAAAALHAAGSAAALALALTFAMEKGWLTVGLALMAPGIAWVAEKRPLPLLRWMAAATAVLVVARIAWEPRIVGADVGATPIFNWLLYGYGMPALAFWTAGYLLRRRADDVPSRTVEAAAILFTVLFAFLEIRHAMNGGNIYAVHAGLAEVALQVSVGLALTIGLERLRVRTGNLVHDVAALIIAGLPLAFIVVGLFVVDNPLVTNDPVGGAFLNLILLGYGLPAVLAILLALFARTTRPTPYRAVAAAVSVVLALAYLTLEIMRLYHGPVLTDGAISDAEQYTFSAVWLAFGLAVLLAGLLLASKPARLASAAVIMLTVAKVFLIDMYAITGIWRALSFIVLGLVLVGIGYLYQRLVFPARGRQTTAAPPADGSTVEEIE